MVMVVGRSGHPGYPRAVWRVFWSGVAQGLLTGDAAVLAGVSKRPAYWQFTHCGGVIPSYEVLVAAGAGGRLRPEEREEIALLNAEGLGVREVARRVGRSPSTISRELRRNASAHDGRYRPAVAQRRAEDRAKEAGRAASPVKLATNVRLRGEVQARLEHNHSPEQIAQRLRQDFPDEPEMWVSHETIYQSLYIQGRGGLKRELTKHLRSGRSLRQPRAQAATRRAQVSSTPIKDMVNISQRPAEAADRAVPGHWEGDLIAGAGNKTAIGTLVERTTGFVILVHLPDGHGALAVQEGVIAAMADLPQLLRKTLTWDQGREMANHAAITAATDLKVYFCDPHSPWQRPTNENTNGLLRQYFPKGTDLSIHGVGILERVAIEINNRPRKRLDWATPAEALDKLLSDHDNDGVAHAG
jgi:IS30 family transposase